MIEINGLLWDIRVEYPYDPIFLNKERVYTLGACDTATRTIYLASSIRRSKLKEVLCHEIVHSAMFSYDVQLNYEQEELLANIIATYGEEIINITNTKITLNTVNLLGKFIYISPLCFFLLYINSKKK